MIPEWKTKSELMKKGKNTVSAAAATRQVMLASAAGPIKKLYGLCDNNDNGRINSVTRATLQMEHGCRH